MCFVWLRRACAEHCCVVSLPSALSLPPECYSSPIRQQLYGMPRQEQLQLTAGVSEALERHQGGGLLPVLLFSAGVPWVEPCVKHICCLWDVAERYKDHDLLTAL